MTQKTVTEEWEDRCWNRIGIGGDRSCPRLEDHIHCRNCPVFARQGRRLLDREPPAGYIEEWTDILAPSKEQEPTGTVSVVVFRIGHEWLAFKTEFFQEIAGMRTVRTIPLTGTEILRGLVNINGELLLCVSLAALLGIERTGDPKRLLVMGLQGQRWTFPVEEVFGLYRMVEDSLEEAPVTLTKAAVNHSAGLFSCQDRRVAMLDWQLVSSTLKRSIR